MFGETQFLHDGIRAFNMTVGYPGWNRESILIHEIQKAHSVGRLKDLRYATANYCEDGNITERVRDNLFLNIDRIIEEKR